MRTRDDMPPLHRQRRRQGHRSTEGADKRTDAGRVIEILELERRNEEEEEMKRVLLYTLAAYLCSMAALFGAYSAVRVIDWTNRVDTGSDDAAMERAQAWLD